MEADAADDLISDDGDTPVLVREVMLCTRAAPTAHSKTQVGDDESKMNPIVSSVSGAATCMRRASGSRLAMAEHPTRREQGRPQRRLPLPQGTLGPPLPQGTLGPP